jgi:hypothetical protein
MVKVNKGDIYNFLIILEEVEPSYGSTGTKHRMVKCECRCGTIKNFKLHDLRTNNTKSCGCYNSEVISKRNKIYKRIIHGETLDYGMSREYQCLADIKQRCFNIKNKFYNRYGGRGITVCERWLEPNGQGYINFINDMGRRPDSNHSIERTDNDGNYEPSNCKWATRSEQQKNKSSFKRR